MASIGTVEVEKMDGEVMFSGELLNLTITGGRAFMQIGGGGHTLDAPAEGAALQIGIPWSGGNGRRGVHRHL